MVGNNYVIYFAGLINNEYEESNDYKNIIKSIKDVINKKAKELNSGKNIVFIDPIKNSFNKKSYSVNEVIKLDNKSKSYSDLIIYVLDSFSSSTKILDMIATYETNDSKDIVLYSVFDSDKEKYMNYCLGLLDDNYLIYKDISKLVNHIMYKLDNEEDDFSSFLKSIHSSNNDEEIVEEVKTKTKKNINKLQDDDIDEKFKKLVERRNISIPGYTSVETTTTNGAPNNYINSMSTKTNTSGPAQARIRITSDPEEEEARYLEESRRGYDPSLYKDNYVATPELPFQTAKPKPLDYKYNRPAGTTVGSRHYTPSRDSIQGNGRGRETKLPMASIQPNKTNNINHSNNISNIQNTGVVKGEGPAPAKIEIKNKEGGNQIGIL